MDACRSFSVWWVPSYFTTVVVSSLAEALLLVPGSLATSSGLVLRTCSNH
jgi:hypothetical protein